MLIKLSASQTKYFKRFSFKEFVQTAGLTCKVHATSFFSKGKTWNAAKSACEALSAKLVVLSSLAENQAVGEKITGGQGTYIGLYRNPKDKSRWLWVDESRATYTHWHVGEPNNCRGNQNCVQMYSKSVGYKWNDLICNHLYHVPYVCETSGK